MCLEPHIAAKLPPGQKNGFLVSKNPGNHAAHTKELRSRMPVARELAKATDAAAEAASLSDFDLARAAQVARDEGLDPRHALAASFNNGMATALKKFRDRVVDVAKALKAGGCMRSTTSKSRPSKRPRRDAPWQTMCAWVQHRLRWCATVCGDAALCWLLQALGRPVRRMRQL